MGRKQSPIYLESILQIEAAKKLRETMFGKYTIEQFEAAALASA